MLTYIQYLNGDLLCRYKLAASSNANFPSYVGSRKPATPGRQRNQEMYSCSIKDSA